MVKIFFALTAAWLTLTLTAFDQNDWSKRFQAAETAFARGRFAAVIPQYRKLLADLPENAAGAAVAISGTSSGDTGASVGNAGTAAGTCFLRLTRALTKLDRLDEWNTDYGAALKRFGRSADFLCTLAEAALPPRGYWENDELLRGTAPEGCPVVNTAEYDRHRLLQAFTALLPAMEQADKSLQARFYFQLARLLLRQRDGGRMWLLETMTPLADAPPRGDEQHAWQPVQLLHADGTLLTFPLRSGWDDARNDGERCRWALNAAIAAGHPEAALALIRWMHQLYGGSGFAGTAEEMAQLAALHDNEIWLADAGKKIRVPADSHFLLLLQGFLELNPDNAEGWKHLADFRRERHQYPAAAVALKHYLRLKPDDRAAQSAWNDLTRPQLHLRARSFTTVPQQILKLGFSYRNSKNVDYQLRRVDTDKLLPLWIAELLIPDNAGGTDLRNTAGRLLKEPEWQTAVGETLLQKRLTLKPDPRMFMVNGTFTLPPLSSGVYLFTARPQNGEQPEAALIFVVDRSLLCRSGSDYESLFLVDADTGKPAPGQEITIYRTLVEIARNPAELKLFGGRQRITVQERTLKTDDNGQAVLPFDDEGGPLLYALVRDDAGGMAVLPHYVRRTGQSQDNRDIRAFVITDAPVYRPGQQLELECYIRRTGYGVADPETEFSNAKYKIELYSARGELFTTVDAITSDFATFRSKIQLPETAPLGVWMGRVTDADKNDYGSFRFSVEEYRKPEYTVTLEPPDTQIRLGTRAEVTLSAQYYFGAPVANAAVQYRIYREPHTLPSPRTGPWDWLYARSTGIHPGHFEPETLIHQGQGVTDSNGKLRIPVDTDAEAKRFGKLDMTCRIEAEVSDSANRRQNCVVRIPVAAVPFRSASWLNGDFFKPGERIVLHVSARRADGSPVAGRGETRIYRLRLEQGDEIRSNDPLHIIRFETSAENPIKELPIKIHLPGVYGAVTTIRTDKRESSETTTRIRVRHDHGGGTAVFSVDQLEMLTNRDQYRPGDEIKLLFSSRQRHGHVLCFIRSTGDGGGEYRIVPIENHSGSLSFVTSDSDSPNLFVDAAMFADGKWHKISREISIPPAKRLLNVAITPPAGTLSPGDRGEIVLQLRDAADKPSAGHVTVAVYDQAIEDFAGGSNVPAILPFFWSWRRYHFPNWMLLHNDDDGAMPMVDGVMPLMARNMPVGSVAAEAAADNGSRVMRRQFSDRLLWVARSSVDDSGKIELPFVLPDNLTRWRIRAWAMAPGCKAGEATADFTVTKPFVARLAAPRALNAGDQSEITGILHNLDEDDQAVEVVSTIPGGADDDAVQTTEITVPGHGQAAVVRKITADKPGNVEITLRAQNDQVADGVVQTITVLPNITRQFHTAAGTLMPGEKSLSFPLYLPENTDPSTVSLMVSAAPTVAHAMLEMLPMLQNRSNDIFSRIENFLPAVMVRQALLKGGYQLGDTALPPAVPLSADFDPVPPEHSAPVNAAEFERRTREHLQMIIALQNHDGGWGWFSGAAERSWPDTTAAVVQTLAAVPAAPEIAGALKRGRAWLERDAAIRFKKLQQKPDAVPEDIDAVRVEALADAGSPKPDLADRLYRQRAELPVISLIRLARAAAHWPEMKAEAVELRKLLKQYIVRDGAAKQPRLKFPADRYRDPALAASLYIRLLTETEPENPVLPALVRQLVESWRYAPEENSPRTLGEGMRALAAWLAVSHENREPRKIEILLDGVSMHTRTVSDADHRILLQPSRWTSGVHEVVIRQQDDGYLYCHVAFAFDNRNETVPAAGRELQVSRKLYWLTPSTGMLYTGNAHGRPVAAEALRWERSEIEPGSIIPAGAVVEEELTVEADADCTYVRLRAPRPAGFAQLDTRSGWMSDNLLPVYGEFRTSYNDFYCRLLRRGKNVIRHRMIAETPGIYRWAPATVQSLYVPVLRGNSGSAGVEIQSQ